MIIMPLRTIVAVRVSEKKPTNLRTISLTIPCVPLKIEPFIKYVYFISFFFFRFQLKSKLNQ